MALHFLNDVANDAESTQKSKIIACLKSETMDKLINRIPGQRFTNNLSAKKILGLRTS